MGFMGMLPALAWNPWSYAIARFFSGIGVGACFVVYLSHLMVTLHPIFSYVYKKILIPIFTKQEFLTPSWRTICGTVSFWPIGEIFLAPLAYFIGSWRWLTFATAVPALLLVPFYLQVLHYCIYLHCTRT